MIADGTKTIELRSWPTNFRGELLIVSSASPSGLGPAGCALAVVSLVNCRRATVADGARACTTVLPNAVFYAWELALAHKLRSPVALRGQLGLYDVPDIYIPEVFGEDPEAEH